MNKKEITDLIITMAKNVVCSKIPFDSECMRIAEKIVIYEKAVFTLLNDKEIESIIYLLSEYYSYDEVDECIDFLQKVNFL